MNQVVAHFDRLIDVLPMTIAYYCRETSPLRVKAHPNIFLIMETPDFAQQYVGTRARKSRGNNELFQGAMKGLFEGENPGQKRFCVMTVLDQFSDSALCLIDS